MGEGETEVEIVAMMALSAGSQHVPFTSRERWACMVRESFGTMEWQHGGIIPTSLQCPRMYPTFPLAPNCVGMMSRRKLMYMLRKAHRMSLAKIIRACLVMPLFGLQLKKVPGAQKCVGDRLRPLFCVVSPPFRHLSTRLP